MTLKMLHRVLITAGIVLGLLCVVFVAYRYFAQGDASLVPTGIIGAVAVVALAVYLRWFLRKRA